MKIFNNLFYYSNYIHYNYRFLTLVSIGVFVSFILLDKTNNIRTLSHTYVRM